MTDAQVEARIAQELGPLEKLLWSGRPRRGLRLNPVDIVLVPFSLFFLGFALYWESSALGSAAPTDFKLAGALFVLVGAYLAIGRFFLVAWRRARTAYAITDARVIILSWFAWERVKSLKLQYIANMSVVEELDGTGTILLGPSPNGGFFAGTGWPRRGLYAPPEMDGIFDVTSVYALLRKAQKAAEEVMLRSSAVPGSH